MSRDRAAAELGETLSAICDASATADQMARLAERLRGDADARRAYVRYLDMHGRLAALADLPQAASDRPATVRPRPARAAAVLAALALAAAGIAILAPWAAKPDRLTELPNEYVATIVEAADDAALNGRPAATGGRVAPADYRITGGGCTLRFDGGARLYFEPGTAFTIRSRTAVHVAGGAFAFRGDVTCEAISITTPHSTLVDVGTEYSAVVGPGSENLQVIDGRVRRTPIRGPGAAEELVPARSGRAYTGRAGTGWSIPFDPSLVERAAAMATARPAREPALLASDRFTAAAGPLGGASGGHGWSSSWISHEQLPEFEVVHPGLRPDSGALRHPGGGTAAAHRYLSQPIDLSTDAVRYVRFLFRRPVAAPNDPNLAMLVLRTYGLTTEEEVARRSSLHLAVYGTDALVVKFDGRSARVAVPQGRGETLALVAKIVSGASLPDQVFASVLPADAVGDREPLEWAVATESLGTDHLFNQVSMEAVGRGGMLVGDVAIGDSWSSVTLPGAPSP